MDNIGGILGCLGVMLLLMASWVIIFGIVAIPTYVVLGLYAGLKFLATNIFIVLDKLFYPGFDVPAIAVWGFWGLIGGISIQGYREMQIYGRKGVGILIALIPVLLLGLTGIIKAVDVPTFSGIRTTTKVGQNTSESTRKPSQSTKPTSITTTRPTTTSKRKSTTHVEPTRGTVERNTVSRSTPKRRKPVHLTTRQNMGTTPTTMYFNMVLIPAGEFQMGDDDHADEQPVHTVYIDAFYMDKYEVTNAQYKRFLDATPQWRKSRIASPYHDGDYLKHWNGNNYPLGKGEHPVTYVSWYAAMAYAKWADKRLPTEAEWEKAARGGLVGQKYPWGNSIDSTKANYNKQVGDTTLVGRYSPNAYGLYDMAGNVLEWCLDTYDADFYVSSSRQNPISGGSALKVTVNFSKISTAPRVLRGGSWSTLSQSVRVADRTKGNPKLSYFGAGFRCVRTRTP